MEKLPMEKLETTKISDAADCEQRDESKLCLLEVCADHSAPQQQRGQTPYFVDGQPAMPNSEPGSGANQPADRLKSLMRHVLPEVWFKK